jgi:Ala-tRNA(Pro) deacylase
MAEAQFDCNREMDAVSPPSAQRLRACGPAMQRPQILCSQPCLVIRNALEARTRMTTTPRQLFDFLAGLGIDVRTVEHPPLYTVVESRALRGEIAGGHTKNLFLKDKKGSYFLVTLEEDAEVDLKRIHEKIGASGRVSFGKPEALMELLGVEPGGVTAFGLVNDREHRVRFVLEEGLMRHDTINAHPLTNTATTSIGRDDLLAFVRATGHDPAILKLSD